MSPGSLAAGVLNSGLQTWINSPEEWGSGWDGFGKRMATRQAQTMMSRGIEASVGTLWGEDPRYFAAQGKGFGGRITHAVSSAFLTYRPDGTRGPAWARGVGIVGSRMITSTWRPRDEQGLWKLSAQPLGTGFMGRVTSNIFREFSPDIRRMVFRKSK
jgi:hypothetical protein